MAVATASNEGGYVTDEELELCQTLEPNKSSASASVAAASASKMTSKHSNTMAEKKQKVVGSEVTKSLPIGASSGILATAASTASEAANKVAAAAAAASATSPSKEVLIGGDNNPSRR